jgi:hypothetical protein
LAGEYRAVLVGSPLTLTPRRFAIRPGRIARVLLEPPGAALDQ